MTNTTRNSGQTAANGGLVYAARASNEVVRNRSAFACLRTSIFGVSAQ